MNAVIVYHKNIKQYPKEWIDKFRESILNQTFRDFDILELDYGGGNEKIFSSPFLFSNYKLPTFAHAMNFLFDLCKGYECVFNTNCDDYYSLDRMEKQIKYIKKGYDVVSSNFVLLEEGKETERHEFNRLDIKKELSMENNVICHPVIAYSKKFLRKNRYIPSEIPFEDMLLWKRTIDEYKFIILKDNLCFHRIHNNSVSSKSNES